jgi:hypothetical protein
LSRLFIGNNAYWIEAQLHPKASIPGVKEESKIAYFQKRNLAHDNIESEGYI